MNDIIQLLPDAVANQIAAGEVVQRPASVVKELLENAIDAGATKIQLVIENAGKSLIQLIDNGKGMSATDARMCFERHATSKIRTTEDILSINTKGFRGEALASIAAVAQVELKTRTAEEDLGHYIRIEGSQVKEQDVVQTPLGTIVSVRNLFFNIPARRNFLKSNQVEMRHIIDEFHRVCLTHSSIAFSLHHNRNELFNLSKGTFRQRIAAIFGRKQNGQLVPLDENTDLVVVKGFVVKPEGAKKKRGNQFFFVNNRFIRNAYLHKAVVEAFDKLLPRDYYPGYFIQLEINPKRIDINIHPTKTEIKFDDEYSLFAILRSVIKHSLGQYNIAPSLDFGLNPALDIPLKNKNRSIKTPVIRVDPDFNPFKKEGKLSLKAKEKTKAFYESFTTEESTPSPTVTNPAIIDSGKSEALSTSDIFNPQNISGEKSLQIHQKYLLFQTSSGVAVIDQYRAHQRVLFEQYLSQFEQHQISGQHLMFPLTIPVTELEKSIIEEIEPTLAQLGFHIEILDNTISVKTVPANVESSQVKNIIEQLMENPINEATFNIIENISLKMAKATAVKRGQLLAQEEIKHLIEALFATSNPNFSPEGKSIFLNLNLNFIEKQLGT